MREPGVWIECRLGMRLYSFTVRLRRGNIFALSHNDDDIPRHACMDALTGYQYPIMCPEACEVKVENVSTGFCDRKVRGEKA